MVNVTDYLNPVLIELQKQWPANRRVNIVCHGHSVPAGYFATPYVNPLEAYPHLLFKQIKQRFPFAVVNVIVTAVGGEHSEQGMERFESEAMCHNPDVVTIDYGLNDGGIGLEKARYCWANMIETALARDTKVILLTPSWDRSGFSRDEGFTRLSAHAGQIRALAEEYKVGLADVFARFDEYVTRDEKLVSLLSHINHPSLAGHQIIADEIAKYFLAQ